VLAKVLDAYHTQTDGPRFKVSVSHWGLHIIPTQMRDVNGHFVRVVALLDTSINIPIAKRRPTEHFRAICEAVSVSTGITLNLSAGFLDQYYAPNGILPPRVMADSDKEQISFAWGATKMSAREAIIDLLEGSATSMTWRLLCESEGCYFNLLPIEVVIQDSDGQFIRKTLSYDRCKKCPPLPGK
jgi:hypothetical protein